MNQMQEKFEVGFSVPKDEAPDYWVHPADARVKKNQPGRTGEPGGDYDSRYMNNSVNFNSLPPGSDIEDQEVKDVRRMRIITSGEDDVTTPTTPVVFERGFARAPLKPTDDMYSNEHVDVFYDDVVVDGQTGFVERGNMLDRM